MIRRCSCILYTPEGRVLRGERKQRYRLTTGHARARDIPGEDCTRGFRQFCRQHFGDLDRSYVPGGKLYPAGSLFRAFSNFLNSFL